MRRRYDGFSKASKNDARIEYLLYYVIAIAHGKKLITKGRKINGRFEECYYITRLIRKCIYRNISSEIHITLLLHSNISDIWQWQNGSHRILSTYYFGLTLVCSRVIEIANYLVTTLPYFPTRL